MFLDVIMGRKQQVRLALSPGAVAVLDELAQQTELSRAELVEAIAEGRLVTQATDPEWIFVLDTTDDHTAVIPASVSPATPSAPELATDLPVSAPPATTAHSTNLADESSTIAELEQTCATLRTQLNEARSRLRHWQDQRSDAQHIAVSPQATAPTTSAVPTVVTDITARLRAELTDLKGAYADLTAAYREQQDQNQTLHQQLAAQAAIATIGEAQLNQWRYRNFSR